MNTVTLPPSIGLLPLRDGERVSRNDFERRYEAMPDQKAELLDGVVYMASPATEKHSSPHGDLFGWLYTYQISAPGLIAGIEGSTRLDADSEPQPDVYLRIDETHGGQSRLDADNYIVGAPELVGEIAYSSLPVDRNVKKPIYQRSGVREFILWNVQGRKIDWFVLRGDEYATLAAGGDGIVRSEVFPGLWLDAEAMVHRDFTSVMRVLQQGIASPEHALFVERLERAAQNRDE